MDPRVRHGGEARSGRLRPTGYSRRFPTAVLALIGATVLAYVAELAGGGMSSCEQFGFVPERFLRTGDILPALAYPSKRPIQNAV